MMNLQEQPSTAFYVFDIAKLQDRIAYLKAHLPENLQLCYAVKANTFLVPDVQRMVGRMEICSPGEALICENAGVPEDQMVISGVYKDPHVMEDMVKNFDGRIYTIESMTQFELLSELAEKYQRKLPLLLRLTNDSQFGIRADEIETIIANREQYPYLHIQGIQFFSGTQKTSYKKLDRELRKLDQLLSTLKENYNYVAEELEYGTGFPVAYFRDDSFDEEELLREFSASVGRMVNKPAMYIELGRSIAACCGTYYTHVVDKKQNGGQNYLVTDGGMHHLVYFGQHMAMRQPFLSVCGKEAQEPTDIYHICGALCSMNDILVKQVPLPTMEIGDTICFENTGAYCMTEGIALFLSRDLPIIYLKEENGNLKCVRPSTPTHLLNS